MPSPIDAPMAAMNRLAVAGWQMLLLIFFCACLGSGLARSQNLESVLMPGKVIEAHAKLESDCNNCHVRLNPAAQSKLCADCHKEVGADIRDKVGYHGRHAAGNCRSCHTDHRGRAAGIVKLDEANFDHGKTDFLLKGKHKEVSCSSCHVKGVKHRKAPSECVSCHRKDDPHKGNLGAKCESCHTSQTWRETTFDHNKTAFVLQNKHLQAKCASCHQANRYVGTSKTCVACHRKDDAHHGHMGEACDHCHKDAGWKQTNFRHERDTHFPLRESHSGMRCDACHKVNPYQVKTPTRCVSCHIRDDRHKGTLGDKCESCHTERKWSQPRFDHDQQTQFPLRDKHQIAKCESCHVPGSEKTKLSTRCVACHTEEDKKQGHRGNLGDKCETCHTERGWTQTRFRHERDTKFPLLGKHQDIQCKSCHQAPGFRDKTSMTCSSCHHKDDSHKGKLGSACDKCHSEKSWKQVRFDHDQSTGFKLEGAHAKTGCNGCHSTRDDEKYTAGNTCQDCHAKDDVHFKSYGTDCKTCHRVSTWKDVSKRPDDKDWPFRRR